MNWERLIDFRLRLHLHPQTFYRKLDTWQGEAPELRRGLGQTNRFIRSNPSFDRFCRLRRKPKTV